MGNYFNFYARFTHLHKIWVRFSKVKLERKMHTSLIVIIVIISSSSIVADSSCVFNASSSKYEIFTMVYY